MERKRILGITEVEATGEEENTRILGITEVGTNGEEENSRYNRGANKWRGREF